MKKISTKHLVLAIILLISIVGGLVDIYATANGPWGYNDPVEYIATAHSLNTGQGLGYVQGHGRFSPIKIHPPFYSLVLAAIGLFKANLIVASRWLNILAFMGCIFIAGWIFYRYSRAPAMGILTSALLLAFPNMLWMFSSAYSEPLFILLILSGGLCLMAFLHQERLSTLIASAILIGLIAATRYAGIAMVAAGSLSVLLLSSGRTRIRIRKAFLFGLLSSLPVLIWLVWIYFSSAHSLGGRSFGLTLNGLADHFQTFRGLFIDTIGRWVPFQSNKLAFTYRLRFLLSGIGLAGILALSTWSILRLHRKASLRPDRSDLPIFAFFGLSAFFFITVLLLTYLFTRPTIDIDNRMLLPFFVCCVMALYGAFALWQEASTVDVKLSLIKTVITKGLKSVFEKTAWSNGWKIMFQTLAWLVAAACLVWYIPRARDMATFYHKGDGLTAYQWGNSKIIQAVNALPAEQPVISSNWQLVLLWTGRPVYGIWVSFPATLPIQSTSYGTLQSDPTQVVFCSKGGALVVFNDLKSQLPGKLVNVPVDRLQKLFDGLRVYGKYADGTIYLCP
jgi:4-amino-4-deoxy-L-arabinose transferase-like glycosyltransferase